VPLGRLLVFIERHHVHRAHLLDALPQVWQVSSSAASSSPARRQSLIGAQHLGLNIHFSQAACLKMLQIGAQLGHLARALLRSSRN
jgi:hypothetical protein